MDVLKRAEFDREKALKIVEKCGIVAAWESIGATVSLVGSVRMGLFTTNRLDVDFHVYTENVDAASSFAAVGKIARTPGVFKVEYLNFLETDERCLQWRVWYADPDGADLSDVSDSTVRKNVEKRDEWAIDLVHIEKNSRYDGYFEDVADRIVAVLTPETRRAVLEIKANLPDSASVLGVEIYRAVLDGGVRDVETFLAWRRENPVEGVLEWKPRQSEK